MWNDSSKAWNRKVKQNKYLEHIDTHRWFTIITYYRRIGDVCLIREINLVWRTL